MTGMMVDQPDQHDNAGARVALILGAAVWPDGPSPTLRRRTLHAAGLYHAGRVSRLIACGGMGRYPPTEAAAMRDVLVAAGVPADCIGLEDQSTNTLENIRNALPLLPGPFCRARNVLIVTDWYHAPRARLIARRLGLSPRTSSPPLAGARLGQQIRSGLREVPAYIWAWLRV